jgi:hypothetical protein
VFVILQSYWSLYPVIAVLPPHLPSKPPPPSHPGPQRRGTQTSPAASDRNSYPLQQGPDDGVDGPPQTGPTQDPRRTAFLSLSSPILLPNPTSSLDLGPCSSQSTPSTPILPQSFQGIHPSRLARLRTDVFDPAFTNNSELPAVANPTVGPPQSLPTRSVSMSRSESAPIIPTGMHPDRIPLLSAHDRPPSTSTSTAPEVLLPGSFATPLISSNQPTPTEAHNKPDPSPGWSKKGKAGQKRKASEPLPPDPYKPPKFLKGKRGKRGGGKNTGGSGKAQGGSRKRKAKATSQPGPSNPHHGKRSAEGEGGREDGEW